MLVDVTVVYVMLVDVTVVYVVLVDVTVVYVLLVDVTVSVRRSVCHASGCNCLCHTRWRPVVDYLLPRTQLAYRSSLQENHQSCVYVE